MDQDKDYEDVLANGKVIFVVFGHLGHLLWKMRMFIFCYHLESLSLTSSSSR